MCARGRVIRGTPTSQYCDGLIVEDAATPMCRRNALTTAGRPRAPGGTTEGGRPCRVGFWPICMS
jgi:hypothetical protein